jgi:Tfp pilus assembly protein FimV
MGKADMDAKQWEQDAAEKQQRIAELEAELGKLQQELQQQISSHEVRAQLASFVMQVQATCASRMLHAVCWRMHRRLVCVGGLVSSTSIPQSCAAGVAALICLVVRA